MKIIGTIKNPHAVERLAEQEANAQFLRQARRNKRRSDQQDFRVSEHEWALFIGDKPAGEHKVMTGKEAFVLNKKFEQVFWRALDTNKGARLHRWQVVRRYVGAKTDAA